MMLIGHGACAATVKQFTFTLLLLPVEYLSFHELFNPPTIILSVVNLSVFIYFYFVIKQEKQFLKKKYWFGEHLTQS